MNLRPAVPDDVELMAALHGTAFEASWSPDTIAELLAAPGSVGLVVEDETLEAMILWRTVADEAEVLTVAVDPRRRREGLATLLVSAAMDLARASGAARVFLEVAVDNAAATALYRRLGFEEVGVRPGYYDRGAARVDALVMRRDLNSGPPKSYP